MSDIFLSYDSHDIEIAKVLAAALELEGWTVFFDRKIPPGKTWRQFIGAEIDKCLCMVVAWSKHSIESDWVYEEADIAKKRNILVPILLDHVHPPLGFTSIQAANLVGWQGKQDKSEGYNALCQSIKEIVGQRPRFQYSSFYASQTTKKDQLKEEKQFKFNTFYKILEEKSILKMGAALLAIGIFLVVVQTSSFVKDDVFYNETSDVKTPSQQPKNEVPTFVTGFSQKQEQKKGVDQPVVEKDKKKNETAIEPIVIGGAKPVEPSAEFLYKQAMVFYDGNQFKDALPLLQQAAQKGYVEAQHKLGLIYERGNGVKPDANKAKLWYEQANKQDYAKSKVNLAALLLRNHPSIEDKKKALELIQQAAAQGQQDAEFHLSRFYARGELGLAKDLSAAKKWCQKAQQHGYKHTNKCMF